MKDAEFNEAKQLYLEKYGDAIVTNNYLKLAVALLCLAVLGLVVLNLHTIRTFQSFRPLVIRIDELGRAQAVDYKSLEIPSRRPRSQIFPVGVLQPLLPPQSLHHSRRLHQSPLFPRRRSCQRHDGAVEERRHNQRFS